jgi:AraC family transcriptional regulator
MAVVFVQEEPCFSRRFAAWGKLLFWVMRGEVRPVGARAPLPPDDATPTRTLAAGDGWSLHEIVCRAGPSDRPFEEQHNGFSVAAVVQGSFTYRSGAGHGLLYPGALLLGNNGSCFECGHPHGIGDRCISLNVHEEEFSEVAATTGLTSRFRFSAPSLPSSRALPVIAQMDALSLAASSPRSEERVLQIIEFVISVMTGDRQIQAAPTGRETRRVVEAIRLVEADAARPLGLKEMAAAAGMSKYHFLRVFRRLTGVTPHRYLVSARLRRAALALASSRRPVIAIALDAGFGDLSTFNKTFRAVFGLTPTGYRASQL